ncbi:MAG: hypothetical protein Q8936_02610 [Bacillota bacterium]|nr:hypothetical protein [Bacillota bacterium]
MMFGKRCEKDVEVKEISTKIVTDQQNCIKVMDGEGNLVVKGGTAITGFLDIEKLITIEDTVLFLEKKYPFGIVILAIDTDPEKE